MAQLDDFNKIIVGGNEKSKVLHQGKTIWQGSGLIAGDMEAGFYGEVPASEFITGDELCSLLRLTAGISQFSDEPWLKFSYLGETVFISKKPIRYRVSWNQLNTAGITSGKKIVTIKGQNYKVSLPKGKTEGMQDDTSAASGSINHNSMWNRLLGQVHEKAPSSWSYPHAMESTLVNWGINYTNIDLHSYQTLVNGYGTWCQEYGDSTSTRIMRGENDISFSRARTFSTANDAYGFRPVLTLVP